MNEHTPDTQPRDYTDRDIQLKAILKFAVGIAIFTVAVFASIAYVQHYWERQAAAADAQLPPMSTTRRLPEQALLQVTEVKDLTAHRAWESNLTTNYATVDKDAGVYRIPVEKAMDIIAARGLPTRGAHTP